MFTSSRISKDHNSFLFSFWETRPWSRGRQLRAMRDQPQAMKFYMSSKVQCSFIIEDHLCELGKNFLKLERSKERERGRVTPNMEEIAKKCPLGDMLGVRNAPARAHFFGGGGPEGPPQKKSRSCWVGVTNISKHLSRSGAAHQRVGCQTCLRHVTKV